jgi:hypothetical protein
VHVDLLTLTSNAPHGCGSRAPLSSRVPGSQSGLASGLLNTSRLIGDALGLAVLSTVAASHTHAQLEAGANAASALSGGFEAAFGAGAAIGLLGALLALALL